MKLQSAMEYLMTYGWAILIIAVVMVALFSLGILGGSPLGTTCLPQSGYVCSNPLLHSNKISVTLGQATGTTWTSVNVIWVPSGFTVPTSEGACGSPSNILATNANSITSGILCADAASMPTLDQLTSGQQQPFTFTATYTNPGASTTAVGASASGQIYALYETAAGGSNLLTTQLTSGVNLKAT